MRAPLVLALLFLPALSGCTGDDGPLETIQIGPGDVPIDDSESRTIDCGFGAELHVDISDGDGGRLTVVVEDGSGAPIFDQDFFPGEAGHEGSLAGSSGTWTLTVHRSLELDTGFLAELSC